MIHNLKFIKHQSERIFEIVRIYSYFFRARAILVPRAMKVATKESIPMTPLSSNEDFRKKLLGK